MEKSLRRYTELPYLMDFLLTRELVLLNPRTWDDRNDSHYIEQFANASSSEGVYALCLTQSAETYHHWKVFAPGSGGVCIQFDRDKFLQHVAKVEGLSAKCVIYQTISKLKHAPTRKVDLPFLKRYAFRHEEEFRLFLPTAESLAPVFRIKMPLTAIARIVLSPWLATSVADNVRRTLKLIKGCASLKIHQSTLIENEKWKSLAEFDE